jgi:hypothetical protein
MSFSKMVSRLSCLFWIRSAFTPISSRFSDFSADVDSLSVPESVRTKRNERRALSNLSESNLPSKQFMDEEEEDLVDEELELDKLLADVDLLLNDRLAFFLRSLAWLCEAAFSPFDKLISLVRFVLAISLCEIFSITKKKKTEKLHDEFATFE